MRALVPVAALACALAALPALALAQKVSGRILEANGRVAVSGAVVTLVQGATRVSPVLSGVDGGFLVQAPVAGAWRVRADAVGFIPQFSEPLTLGAGDSATVELRFSPRAQSLEAVRVVTDSRCRTNPEGGDRTAQLWQEIRTALEASAATERERRTPLELTISDHRLDVLRRRLGSHRLTTRNWMGAGFLSAPPDELAAKGYVQPVGDSVAYFAPDATVLTSPSFLATHCFSVVERKPMFGSRELGLAFNPVPQHAVADVDGTLWLDPASSALKRLEITFRVPGRTSSLPDASGEVEYARLPNGRWFVSHWVLRMPVVREVGPRVGGAVSVALSGWREREGDARALSARDARRNARSAYVTGRVMDSTTMRALAGAEVRLEGVGVVTTGADGWFDFVVKEPLAVPSPATLTLSAARVAALGLEAPSRELALVPGDTIRLDLAIPPVVALGRVLCPPSADSVALSADASLAGPAGPGVVIGTLRSGELPNNGASVLITALWWLDNSGNPATGRTDQTVRRGVLANSNGRFALCGLPVDVPVELRAESGSVRGPAVELTLTEGWLSEEVLTLAPAPSPAPPPSRP